MPRQDKFSRPESDQMGQLQTQVDEVKGVMTQNIEKVMERGERLEDLIAQTNDLEAHVSRMKCPSIDSIFIQDIVRDWKVSPLKRSPPV